MSELLNFPDTETVKGFSTNSVSTKAGAKQRTNAIDIGEEYIMLSNIFGYEELKNSPNFAIKIFHKAVYRGELNNNKRHSRG